MLVLAVVVVAGVDSVEADKVEGTDKDDCCCQDVGHLRTKGNCFSVDALLRRKVWIFSAMALLRRYSQVTSYLSMKPRSTKRDLVTAPCLLKKAVACTIPCDNSRT